MTCQDCTSSFSATDLVSILLAASAFVVSIASLYYAALRRPSIDLDVISARVAQGNWIAPGMPYEDRVLIQAYYTNSGAAGTFLESLDVTNFSLMIRRPP